MHGYHVVPNHVHSESNGLSGFEDSLYTPNDMKYLSALDNKENNFLNLESDSEDTDQLELALCTGDFSNSPAEATDANDQCFDLSLDSDTDMEFDESLELEWDDCDEEGDDLFCSMQEEQCESIAEPSGDQLVYKIPEVSSLSFNGLANFPDNNEIYLDLPSHDGATVEVLAVSSEATPDCGMKDITTTSGIVTVDQLCSSAITTVCFTSSKNFTCENVYSPLTVNITASERKQKCICGSPETTNNGVGDSESSCVVSSALLPSQEPSNLLMENVSLHEGFDTVFVMNANRLMIR